MGGHDSTLASDNCCRMRFKIMVSSVLQSLKIRIATSMWWLYSFLLDTNNRPDLKPLWVPVRRWVRLYPKGYCGI